MKKRKGIVKDRKKTIALLLCVCVCVEFDTPEEFKVRMEWVPQNNWSIQGKWKWNNLLVRLVILLHAIAIKTSYRRKLLFWQLANSKRGLFCWYYCSVMLCSCLVKKAIFCFPARSKFLTDLLPIFQQLKTAKKKATEITVCFNWALHFHRLSNEFSW